MGDQWQAASSAPFDRDLELAVIDYKGVHALAFPCRRILNGWIEAASRKRINVRPTHWREWHPGAPQWGTIAKAASPDKPSKP